MLWEKKNKQKKLNLAREENVACWIYFLLTLTVKPFEHASVFVKHS